jgi:hypothetical protein
MDNNAIFLVPGAAWDHGSWEDFGNILIGLLYFILKPADNTK